MSITFEWDEQGFNRGIEEWANEAVRSIAAETQLRLDAIFGAQKGRPVEDVVPALRATMTEMGLTISDDELRGYAEAISTGQGIVLVPEDVTL